MPSLLGCALQLDPRRKFPARSNGVAAAAAATGAGTGVTANALAGGVAAGALSSGSMVQRDQRSPSPEPLQR